MSLFEWCQWLQHTRFATAISESDWLFPLIEGSHILALPLSVGMIVILDLHLLGIAFCDGTGRKLVLNLMGWCKIGFAVMFLTSSLLLVTQAGKAYGNAFFRTKLILLSADGDRFLVLPPARGQELQQLTIFDQGGKVVKKVGEPALYSIGAFSPEGNRLLVMKKDLDTGQEDLWVLAIDTAKATRITDDTRFKTTPLWSPDGKYILYTALLDGDWPVYRKAADGTGKEELLFRHTPGAFVGLSDSSPDGKFLVCDSGGVILLVPLTVSDPAARKPVEYLRDEFDDGTGRLSPYGLFIAYRSDEAKPERFEIYVRPFDAAKPAPDDKKWQVSKDGVFGGNIFFGFPAMLHWRGDGKEILFRAQELDSNDLVMMAADVETAPTFRVGTPKMLFRLPGPVTGSLGGVSRDGQRFVLPVNVPADKTAKSSGAQ